MSLVAGLLHGSSRSHWLRKKTSSNPIKSIKDVPPHVEANVGPVDGVNGQLQLIWNRNHSLFSCTGDDLAINLVASLNANHFNHSINAIFLNENIFMH